MINIRKYGVPPFNVAVIHGGPGAPGEMAPVARELSKNMGILEPLQTANSVGGQIIELKKVLEKYANLPVCLVGFSWGAWLSFIFAAKYPLLVKKLILVSSGPFEDSYVQEIMKTRLNRLNEKERFEFNHLDIKKDFSRFGELLGKADAYDPITVNDETLECDSQIFTNVWKEAKNLRSSGKLLNFGKQIICPVVAIHGDYDPHPAEGVQKPLAETLNNFRFLLLEKCGHCPWHERFAKDRFYDVLMKELI